MEEHYVHMHTCTCYMYIHVYAGLVQSCFCDVTTSLEVTKQLTYMYIVYAFNHECFTQ